MFLLMAFAGASRMHKRPTTWNANTARRRILNLQMGDQHRWARTKPLQGWYLQTPPHPANRLSLQASRRELPDEDLPPQCQQRR